MTLLDLTASKRVVVGSEAAALLRSGNKDIWEKPISYGPWIETRRNFFASPRQTSDSATLGESGVRYSWIRSYPTLGDGPPGIPTYSRHTSVAGVNVTSRGIDILGNFDQAVPQQSGSWLRFYSPGQTITLSLMVRSSIERQFAISSRRHDGLGTWLSASTASPRTTILPNVWTRVTQSFANTLNCFVSFRVGFPDSQSFRPGETLDITGLINGSSDYFDGFTPDTDTTRTFWSGPENASPSVEETRLILF